ncbi:hypothetical protein NX059_008870 [Plenodomus lindquistii]|nr:hypothetical protein NX059_008870 [Plenodomus lindquistii]
MADQVRKRRAGVQAKAARRGFAKAFAARENKLAQEHEEFLRQQAAHDQAACDAQLAAEEAAQREKEAATILPSSQPYQPFLYNPPGMWYPLDASTSSEEYQSEASLTEENTGVNVPHIPSPRIPGSYPLVPNARLRAGRVPARPILTPRTRTPFLRSTRPSQQSPSAMLGLRPRTATPEPTVYIVPGPQPRAQKRPRSTYELMEQYFPAGPRGPVNLPTPRREEEMHRSKRTKYQSYVEDAEDEGEMESQG